MALLQTKWIADDAVNDQKVKLRNNQNLRARNAADSADINILKVNASNEIEFASTPKIGANTIQTSADKGVANGLAPLNGSSKIDATYLPSYVDDVEEYANFAALPGVGETGKIYVTLDNNEVFRWTGSVYVEISPSEVASVNGAVGVVVLDADDLLYTQADTDDWTVADNSSIKATLDEVGSRLVAVETGGGNPVPQYQIFTLTGTDITNGYVTLSATPVSNSVAVFPKGGLEQEFGVDFSLTGAQLNFIGDLATILASGDKLIVKYLS
jgi:hypothetical protein